MFGIIRQETKKTLREFKELFSSRQRISRSDVGGGLRLLVGYPRVAASFSLLCLVFGIFAVAGAFDKPIYTSLVEERRYLFAGILWIFAVCLGAVAILGFTKQRAADR